LEIIEMDPTLSQYMMPMPYCGGLGNVQMQQGPYSYDPNNPPRWLHELAVLCAAAAAATVYKPLAQRYATAMATTDRLRSLARE
jgi:hypothetical protein